MGRRISFFYRRHQLSGEIRRQVADVIGARVNPSSDTEQDICIGVKMSPYLVYHDKLIDPSRMGDFYLDFIDHHTSIDWLARWPEIKLIVCSRSGERYLREHLKNPLRFIPQHHCNVERHRRPHRPMKTVVFVGVLTERPPWYDWVNRAMANMGLTMRWVTDFRTRKDVVDAYLDADLQFYWREGMPEKLRHLKNPMRIISAASFGIPTVVNQEPCYAAECDSHYLGFEKIGDALDAVRELQHDPSKYAALAEPGPIWTEPYHLDHVAEAFRRLADE